jgi:hypothetical protein
MTTLPKIKFEPAWRVSDATLILRASWATPQLRREAAAEILRRNNSGASIELSADPKRHQAMLDEALVAEDISERNAA